MDTITRMFFVRHRIRIILSIVQILALVGFGGGVRPVAAFQPLQVDDVRSKDPALPEELGFADTLFAQQDFYRAVTEYKRFVYQYPKHPEVGRARLNMARATIAAQRWEDARVMLGELLEKDVAKHITAQT
ncbi:tetratricopeptide repeat protein, partial [Schnuerera sp.]|uniref:tetratricopeptide repeat protein n=1 Tax=Schnuerera sp. TaxID=2794844 RepID=UPI002C1783E2